MADLEELLMLLPDYDFDDDSDDSDKSCISIQTLPDPALEEAITGLDFFRGAFKQEVKKGDEIRFVIRSYRENGIDRSEFVWRIKGLLIEYPEYLAVINMFTLRWLDNSMPLPGDSDSEKNPILNHVLDFMKRNMLEKFFPTQIVCSMSFLDILFSDNAQKRVINQVYNEMYILFHDKPESLEDFKQLLPRDPSKTSAEEVHEPKPNNGSEKEKESSNPSYLVPSLLAFLLVSIGVGASFMLHRKKN